MRLLARHRRRLTGDGGFSLTEAVIALAIATAMFTALAFSLVGGAQATVLSRQNQQAGDILNQLVEQARAIPYDSLTMRPADLDTGEEPRSPTISSCQCYNPLTDSTSGTGVEPLAAPDANGAISPHVRTVTQNGSTYTVRQYVTVPPDTAGQYKRLTVVVDFVSLGKERKRTYSTVVAPTKRGLPLPDFKFTNDGTNSQCRNPGSSVVYGFKLKNNGARDSWALTATPSTGPAWSFFLDDGDGTWTATDPAAPATATGTPSTGLIEPTASVRIFAVTTLADATTKPAPYTLTVDFTATSVAQPTYAQSLSTTTTVQADACGSVSTTPTTGEPTGTETPPTQPDPSCASLTGPVAASAPGGTVVRYYMHNPDQPSNTPASLGMPVVRDSGTPPATSSLFNYSEDLHSVAGRYLAQGSTTSTSASQVASWDYAMPATSTIKGKGTVTFWAATPSGTTFDAPAFTVVLDVLASDGSFVRNLGSASYTTSTSGWQCTGFRDVSLRLFDIGGSGQKVDANQKLRLRVLVTNAVPMRLAYGTAAYPMELNVPYAVGLG